MHDEETVARRLGRRRRVAPSRLDKLPEAVQRYLLTFLGAQTLQKCLVLCNASRYRQNFTYNVARALALRKRTFVQKHVFFGKFRVVRIVTCKKRRTLEARRWARAPFCHHVVLSQRSPLTVAEERYYHWAHVRPNGACPRNVPHRYRCFTLTDNPALRPFPTAPR